MLAALAVPAVAPAAYDERRSTRWAYVDRATQVHAGPSAGSRTVGRLALRTFLGSPETVLVLGRDGGWQRVRYAGTGRRVGWVPASALSAPTATTMRVVIDLRARRLTLYDGERRVRTFRVGIGAPGSPTPRGRTYVRERVVPSDRRGIYGPVAFGLGAHSRYRTDWPGGGQIGLHGTDQPALVGGRVSNGCVRLTNKAVVRLAARLEVGTPVVVR